MKYILQTNGLLTNCPLFFLRRYLNESAALSEKHNGLITGVLASYSNPQDFVEKYATKSVYYLNQKWRPTFSFYNPQIRTTSLPT
jgi:hypothetical protein